MSKRKILAQDQRMLKGEDQEGPQNNKNFSNLEKLPGSIKEIISIRNGKAFCAGCDDIIDSEGIQIASQPDMTNTDVSHKIIRHLLGPCDQYDYTKDFTQAEKDFFKLCSDQTDECKIQLKKLDQERNPQQSSTSFKDLLFVAFAFIAILALFGVKLYGQQAFNPQISNRTNFKANYTQQLNETYCLENEVENKMKCN